ncbi:MAG: 4Fe-4S dicluster domain-containing protein [Bacillota bacterium]
MSETRQLEEYAVLVVAPEKPHMYLKRKGACRECPGHPCALVCPTEVFAMAEETMTIEYEKCIECGACFYVCPKGNIQWEYPPGGEGVTYRY